MQSDCLGLIVVHSTEHSLRGHSDRVCSDTVTVLKCPKEQQYQERPHIIEEQGAAKVAEYTDGSTDSSDSYTLQKSINCSV